MRFSQDYAGLDSIHKNEAKKPKFGLETSISVLKRLGTDFGIFFLNYVQILDKIGKMSETFDIMGYISKKKNQKSKFCSKRF